MNLEAKFNQLDPIQKVKVCARLMQIAESMHGIKKTMTGQEKEAKSEEIKLLASCLQGFGWLKLKAFKFIAVEAALSTDVAHITPALIVRFIKQNEALLREMCKEENKRLEPIPVPPTPVSDDERLAELPAVAAQEIDPILLQTLLSQVYFPVLERKGLVDEEMFQNLVKQETEANKVRFINDRANIKTAGEFAKFVQGVEGGIYAADALSRARFLYCKHYLKSLKSTQNEKLS